jgi:capsular exopolysaccharide synthesis family protein
VTRRRRERGAGRLLPVVRRHWRLITFVALLGLGAAVVWSLQRTPIYESTASVLVSPPATPPVDGDGPGQLSMHDEEQVVRSTAVAGIVKLRVQTSATPEQLLRYVSAETSGGSRVLRISFSHPVPATAMTGADAFAAAYLEYRRQAVAANVRSLIDDLTRDVADLTAKKDAQEVILAPDSQATTEERDRALTLRDAYSSRIAEINRQLTALRQVKVDPGSVLRPATPPSRSTSSLTRNAGTGMALGLLLGLAAAFVYDRTDRRLRGRDDLAELLDKPVLTLIPPLARWPRSLAGRHRPQPLAVRDSPTSNAAEAYRVLQSRLAFLADQLGTTSIMVTSAAPDEGKSTTAANLALALAEAGRDVLLISADLRRPRLHRLFDLPHSSGLGELLSELRLDSQTEASARITSELWSVAKHLWVLVSRPEPPEVTALLGSEAMRRLLDSQRPCFDFIVLDCPPVLGAADATALAPLVDAVLVVADRPSTDRQTVVQLREQLEEVGGRIVGAVLNRDRSDRVGYQYGT